jgi:hypothetical protein
MAPRASLASCEPPARQSSGTRYDDRPGQILGRLEVLHRIFHARPGDGVDQQIYDLLDMAIGVYDGDKPVALVRSSTRSTRGPHSSPGWAADPRRFFSALGFGRRAYHFDDVGRASNRLEDVARHRLLRAKNSSDLIRPARSPPRSKDQLGSSRRSNQAGTDRRCGRRADRTFVELSGHSPRHAASRATHRRTAGAGPHTPR